MADGLEVSHSKLPERFDPPLQSHEKYTHSQSQEYAVDSRGSPSQQHQVGARRPRIWPIVLAVAITAVVVGAAIGGGLGSQLGCAKHCATKSASSTVKVTATAAVPTNSAGLLEDYSPVPPSQIATVNLDCPGRNKEEYVTTYDPAVNPSKFTIICGRNLYVADNTFAVTLVAYRLNDCIEACGDYKENGECKAITFHDLMHYDGAPTPFNCWLFMGNTTGKAADNGAASAYLSIT